MHLAGLVMAKKRIRGTNWRVSCPRDWCKAGYQPKIQVVLEVSRVFWYPSPELSPCCSSYTECVSHISALYASGSQEPFVPLYYSTAKIIKSMCETAAVCFMVPA